MNNAFVPDPDTWYTLSFAHSGHVLGFESLSDDNGTPLCQSDYEAMGHQQWRFAEVEAGWYELIPRSNPNKTFGTALVLWDHTGVSKQHWAIEACPSGGYRLRSRAQGQVLAVAGAQVCAGAKLEFADADDEADDQRLLIAALPDAALFEPEPGVWYTLRFAHSGHALTVDEWSTQDGAAVVQATNNENLNQQWGFEPAEDGRYFMFPRHCPDKVLDVPGSSKDEGADLIIWAKHGGLNQQWRLVTDKDGFHLRSAVSKGLVAVSGAALTQRARVEQQDTVGALIKPTSKLSQHRRLRVEALGYAGDAAPQALDFGSLRLPPIRCFTSARELTAEVWVRPASTKSEGHETIVEFGENGTRFALQRDDDKAIVRLYRGDRTHTLCEGPLASFAAGRWTHVAVTVEHDNEDNKYPVALYVDGKCVAKGRTGNQSSHDGHKLFTSKIQSEVVAGSELDGGRSFAGRMAELRIWRRRLATGEINQRLRAHGDERDLVACYRLDEVVDGHALDHGRSRLHATITGDEARPSADLPLPATLGAVAQLEVSGKLYRDWLPCACFDEQLLASLRLDEAWQGSEGSSDPSVDDIGTVREDASEGDIVQLSLFEANLTLRDGDQHECADRLLRLWLERDEIGLVDEPDGSSRAELWAAGLHTLRVPETGSITLRFLAQRAEGPTIYARHGLMPIDVWTPVRTEEGLYAAMHEVTPDSLLAPPDGRPSPLPAGATMADADAVTQMVNALAWVVAPGAGGPTATGGASTRGLFSSVSNAIQNIGAAVEGSGDIVWSATAPANDLVGSVANLLDVSTDAIPEIGENAIVRRIAGADQLAGAVSEIPGVGYVVQIVGETAGEYWRVLVTDLREAAAALGAFFKRVGAKLKHFIEMLAALFNWRRYLRTSDDLYAEMLGVFDTLGTQLEGLGEVSAQIAAALDPAPNSPIFDPPFHDQLEALGGVPKLDELDLILRYARRLFKSSKLSLNPPSPSSVPDLALFDVDALTQIFSAALPSMAATPSKVMSASARPVYELPLELWDSVADVIDAVLSAVAEGGSAVLDAVRSLLEARLKIPWLTRMIEDTILSADGQHRELNTLRLFSLAAAIPLVIYEVVSASTRGAELTLMRSDGTAEASGDQQAALDQAKRDYRNASQVSAALGIANWVLWTVREAVACSDKATGGRELLAAIQSLTLMAVCGTEFARGGAAETWASYDEDFSEKYAEFAYAAAVLNFAGAVCTYFSGAHPMSATARTYWMWVGSLGLGAGWITNACVSGGVFSSSTAWEAGYWTTRWALDGCGLFVNAVAQAKKQAGAGKNELNRYRVCFHALGFDALALNVVYLSRAISSY